MVFNAGTAQATVFTDDRAQPVTIGDPGVSRAVSRLAAAFPGTLTLEQLTADQLTANPEGGAEDAARLRRVLLKMVLAGRAGISVLPSPSAGQMDGCPRAWPVARLEAASGQPWLTSLRHVGVPAHPVLRALLPLLDGGHDRAMLQTHPTAGLREGTVPFPEPAAGEQPAPERVDAVAGRCVDWALGYLARNGFLEQTRT